MNDKTNEPVMSTINHIFSANVAVFREDNQKTLIEFFKGLVSGAYRDGNTYSLYLDLADHKIITDNALVPNQRVRNGDPSLALITQTKSAKKSNDYTPIKDDDIGEWGYNGWLEGIEHKIMGIINNK